MFTIGGGNNQTSENGLLPAFFSSHHFPQSLNERRSRNSKGENEAKNEPT